MDADMWRCRTSEGQVGDGAFDWDNSYLCLYMGKGL